ncbi:uncharacterized protein FIBRA_04749 [Fibroporia radiculosa]|uniref:F-box domain-containing protein n=1 Tax=Fibroporia radiculosa TaxID=599839 RepID=J4GPR7_9APHY|nr:uncharacterized protein FIBRA_04749 [Fibroporia radiculosa]CCM02645.1 predicted protein [Fibroporia radiculosa]
MPHKDSSFISRLPVELLLAVKESIGDCDLRTHVCFYNTCRRVAALYDRDGENIWELLCRHVGLGLLHEETRHREEISWKKIAFDCIAEDGFCSHPLCGTRRLTENARSMQEAIRKWGMKFLDSGKAYKPDSRLQGVIINPVFEHIGFQLGHPLQMQFPTEDDAFLHCDDIPGYPQARRTLCKHPIAYRSFATFPPLRWMTLLISPALEYDLLNHSGVTVYDIELDLRADLDRSLTVIDLQELLEGTFRHDIFMPEANGMEILNYTTVRKLWEISRWDGFEQDDEDPYQFWAKFSPLDDATDDEEAQSDADAA